MSESHDVQSLLDDATIDDELRAALQAASGHDPSPGDLASLGHRLAGVLPPGTLPPAPAPPSPPAAPPIAGGAAGGLKMLGVLAIAGAVGSAVWLARTPADVPVVAAPSAAPSVTIARAAEPPASAALPEVDAGANVAASAQPAPSHAAIVPPVAPAEPETAILARAHDALLHGSPDRALAIAGEHARAYPKGTLAQEREVIAIEALVAAGRQDDARARAAAFRTAYPGSSHRGRIDRLVGVP